MHREATAKTGAGPVGSVGRGTMTQSDRQNRCAAVLAALACPPERTARMTGQSQTVGDGSVAIQVNGDNVTIIVGAASLTLARRHRLKAPPASERELLLTELRAQAASAGQQVIQPGQGRVTRTILRIVVRGANHAADHGCRVPLPGAGDDRGLCRRRPAIRAQHAQQERLADDVGTDGVHAAVE